MVRRLGWWRQRLAWRKRRRQRIFGVPCFRPARPADLAPPLPSDSAENEATYIIVCRGRLPPLSGALWPANPARFSVSVQIPGPSPPEMVREIQSPICGFAKHSLDYPSLNWLCTLLEVEPQRPFIAFK